MRILRSRSGVGDEEVPMNGKVQKEMMDVISDEDLVRGRVTRSKKLKNISTTELADETREVEDVENVTVEGIATLQRKRIGKRKSVESADAVVDLPQNAKGKFLAASETQTLSGIRRRIDKGKGIATESALMKNTKVKRVETVLLSSEESENGDDNDEGGMISAVSAGLDQLQSDATAEEVGRVNVGYIETVTNMGSSVTRRNSLRGARGKYKMNPVSLSDSTSPNSEKETESIVANGDGTDVAEEDHRGNTSGGKRGRNLPRGASSGTVDIQEGLRSATEAGPSNNGRGAVSKKRALDIARSRAAHFAHFNGEDEINGYKVTATAPSVEQAEQARRAGELLAEAQASGSVNRSLTSDREDWPGPWSTARRLVEGRSAAAAARQESASQGISRPPLVEWSPSRTTQFCKKRVPSSLHQKCLEVLCGNIEHVESLDGVPDPDKKWIIFGLCARRKLTPAAVRVCISGSPSEITIPDCTCLTQEDITNTLTSCTMERLEVLELGLCGRGITDHCLATICAKKNDSLPKLVTLALKGAYRLVDQGLSRILNAAPALKSIDLTQCSLISESSIEAIADSVGPTLETLVLDSCTQLNGLKLLPSLHKMSNLQRLSLAAIPGVTDGVISELLVSLRFNLQELELRTCQALTDAGIKAVSLCKDLRLLDLGHLPCLTDVAVGLIADNCRNLRTLRLCRGNFSDTAVAALVGASGSCLSELSLNSVRLVGDHTILALAQFSKCSLETIDVSMCRLISDQALGLLADSCPKLHTLRLFGCTQVTNIFLDGHSNENLKVTGIWESPSVTNSTA